MKLFVKLLTAFTAVVALATTQADATIDIVKNKKQAEALGKAYGNYVHAEVTNAPNADTMLKNLNTACDKNCTGSLFSKTCAETPMREFCATRCNSAKIKNCLSKYKDNQSKYLKVKKLTLDPNGIPERPTDIKKAKDNAHASIKSKKASIDARHADHKAHKSKTETQEALAAMRQQSQQDSDDVEGTAAADGGDDAGGDDAGGDEEAAADESGDESGDEEQ